MTGSNPLQERLAAVRAPRQPAATNSAASPARPVGGTPAARGARKPVEQRWDSRVRRATYYIDTEILDRLDDASTRLGRNKSDVVRDAILEYINTH